MYFCKTSQKNSNILANPTKLLSISKFKSLLSSLQIICFQAEKKKKKGKMEIKRLNSWDFPGGPVAKTPPSQMKGAQVWSLVREQIPRDTTWHN